MRIRKSLLLLFVLLFGTFLLACSADTGSEEEEQVADETEKQEETEEEEAEATDGVYGGELNVAFNAQPPTLDIHQSTATASRDTSQHIFEALVTLNSSLEVQPMLAESFDISDDGKTITFHLREGILFHNGEEMTAEDVVASLERWQKKSSQAITYHGDTTFTAEDDYTVVAEIPDPTTLDIYVLADMTQFAAIMPKDIVEAAGEEDDVEEIIGTGPYYLEEWRQDQYIHLKKFEDYESRSEEADGLAGAKHAYVDDIYFHIVTDSSTRTAGLQSGEYDIAVDVPHDVADSLESGGDIYNSIFTTGMLVMMLNNEDGVFSDPKIRAAANAAINVEDVLVASYVDEKYFVKDHALVGLEQTDWYTDVGSDVYNTYDPELAKELLEEAGYDGEEVVLLTNREYEVHYSTAVVMQEQLEEVGMNVKMDIRDWASAIQMAEDPENFDVFYSSFAFRPVPIQQLFLNPEYIGWPDSERLQQLTDDILYADSIEDAQNLTDEFHEAFYEDLPVLKAGNNSSIIALRDHVDGLQYVSGPILWNVYKEE